MHGGDSIKVRTMEDLSARFEGIRSTFEHVKEYL